MDRIVLSVLPARVPPRRAVPYLSGRFSTTCAACRSKCGRNRYNQYPQILRWIYFFRYFSLCLPGSRCDQRPGWQATRPAHHCTSVFFPYDKNTFLGEIPTNGWLMACDSNVTQHIESVGAGFTKFESGCTGHLCTSNLSTKK